MSKQESFCNSKVCFVEGKEGDQDQEEQTIGEVREYEREVKNQ